MKGFIRIIWCTAALIVLTKCDRNDTGPLVEIGDDKFLSALIESGADSDGDGRISRDEAGALTYLDVSDREISDISGIEAFVNLDTLFCSGNQLTHLDVSENTGLVALITGNNQLSTLDVSENTGLIWLDCRENQLTGLDLSGNTALTVLSCEDNLLTALDVSNLAELQHLSCSGNPIQALDVSDNTALKRLYCIGCQLSSLDLSGNVMLERLNLWGNQLTSLDLSGNTALEWLICSNNQLTSLDVSDLVDLRYLGCGANQLTILDISKNTSLGLGLGDVSLNCYLQIEDMPTLEEVSVWRLPFPPAGFLLCREGSPNVYFTTEPVNAYNPNSR